MMQTTALRSNVLSAIGWSAATRFLGQLINWAMTLLVVRFLRPDDYGLMGLAMAAAGFFQSMSYIGISDAVVQSQTIDEEGLRRVFGFVILVNTILLVLLWAAAWPVAEFYGDIRLVRLLQAASLVFVFITLQAIPNALLQKRLDLKRVSRIEITANVVGGFTGLILAWKGYGVWSLMIAMLTAVGLRAGGLCWIEPFWRTPSFRFGGYVHVLQNGMIRTAENTLWYLYSSSDVLLIGKLLGPIPLGIYAVARQIAAIPAQKIATAIKPAAFPAFAMVQHDRAEALRYLSKAMRLIALISFPVFFGISAIAPQIVAIILGPRWDSAIVPLRLLALSMILNSVGAILPSFLMGIGHFRASFRNTLFGTILFPLAYAIGSRWGIEGVCVAAALAYPVQFLVLVRRCVISTGADIGAFLQPLAKPFIGAALMYCCVVGAQAALPHVPQALIALLLVAFGTLIYGSFCLIFCRPTVHEFVALARR
jgi:teichuronic acid exporter